MEGESFFKSSTPQTLHTKRLNGLLLQYKALKTVKHITSILVNIASSHEFFNVDIECSETCE